jgi:hypothetical protein
LTFSTPDQPPQRYVTVILRLVLSDGGALVRGEMLDTQGDLIRRFEGRRGLDRTIRAFLASCALGG